MTGCLFNQLVYCMAIFTNKISEDIPCNTFNMVNSIENANAVSCGNQTDPRFRIQR